MRLPKTSPVNRVRPQPAPLLLLPALAVLREDSIGCVHG
jgi:hypothetical protein